MTYPRLVSVKFLAHSCAQPVKAALLTLLGSASVVYNLTSDYRVGE